MGDTLGTLRIFDATDGPFGLCGRFLAELGADVSAVRSETSDDSLSTVRSRRYINVPKHMFWGTRKNLLEELGKGSGRLGGFDVVIVDDSCALAGGLKQLAQGLADSGRIPVTCAISWFGANGGPFGEWRGSEAVMQAVSGLAATTGVPDDEPTLSRTAIIEHATGYYAAASILAALRQPVRHDARRFLDVCAYDVGVNYLFLFLSRYWVLGERGGPLGNRHSTCAPWNLYPCADGAIVICTTTNKQWERLCQLMGCPGAPNIYPTPTARYQHVDEVDRLVSDWTKCHSVDSVASLLRGIQIAAAPVRAMNELLADQHFIERQLATMSEMQSPSIGDQRGVELTPGSAFKLSKTPAVTRPSTSESPSHLHGAATTRRLKAPRVVELGAYGAGPYVGRLLAELGARVIKIEPPDGDPVKNFQPQINGESYPYLLYNSGKRSISLDLRSETGLAAARSIIRGADALIENLAPGTMNRLGLGYDQVKAINPNLVYCSVSGFGRRGPLSDLLAYDTIIQAASGCMDLTRTRNEGIPVKVGISVADLLPPTAGAAAILAALYYCDRNDQASGQFIDMAMFDVLALATQNNWHTSASSSEPDHANGRRPIVAKCHDGYVVVEMRNSEDLSLLGKVLDIGAAQASGVAGAVVNALPVWASKLRSAEVAGRLQSAGIPAAPVLDVASVAEHEHTHYRQLISVSESSSGSRAPSTRSAMKSVESLPVLSLGPVPLAWTPSELVGDQSGSCWEW